MYKAFRIFLALIIISYIFCGSAGCASKTEKIKITVGMWPETSASSNEVSMFAERKEKFEKDYPEYEIIPASYTYNPNTITAKAVSGQLPVVFRSHCSEAAWLAQSGYIFDVTGELYRLGWLDKMDPVLRRLLTYGSSVYGLPQEGTGLGLFLNLNMLYSAGVIGKNADGSYALYDGSGKPLYPQTFSSIKTASQAVRNYYGNETYGIVLLSDDTCGGRQFVNFAWNFGAGDFQKLQEDGTWISKINSPASVKAMNWIQDMRKSDMVAYPSAYLNNSEWYKNIGAKKVAMAFCFSDELQFPVINHNFPSEDIAFVPMPSGSGSNSFSIADGVAYMFSAKATSRQVKGALLFLKYLGHTPETDAASLEGLDSYYRTISNSGFPVTLSIKAWTDSEYLKAAEEIEKKYINVNTEYFKDFFRYYNTMKREEDQNYRKVMYGMLDLVIQRVLSDPFDANAEKFLSDTNTAFASEYLLRI